MIASGGGRRRAGAARAVEETSCSIATLLKTFVQALPMTAHAYHGGIDCSGAAQFARARIYAVLPSCDLVHWRAGMLM